MPDLNSFGLDAFADHLLLERRLSPATVAAYSSDLFFFVQYVQSVYDESTPQGIKVVHLRSWLAEGAEAGLSSRTLNRRLSALRTYFGFARLLWEGVPQPAVLLRGLKVPKRIVRVLKTDEVERLGGRAMNLNFRTTNVLFGEKLLLEEPGSEPIDLGFVGQVTRVDRQTIESLTYTGQIPFIPSMCIDEKGQKYNVNADTAAMAVAESLGAEKLIFISDVNGVRRDKDDPSSVIHSMTAAEAKALIDQGVISGGMIPKVEACLSTLNRGVGKVHIIDGQLRHSLLLEIYTTAGVGTEILQQRNTAAARI